MCLSIPILYQPSVESESENNTCVLEFPEMASVAAEALLVSSLFSHQRGSRLAVAGWWGKKTPVRESSGGARRGRSRGVSGSLPDTRFPGSMGRGGGIAGGAGTPSRATAPRPPPQQAPFSEYLDLGNIQIGLKSGARGTQEFGGAVYLPVLLPAKD